MSKLQYTHEGRSIPYAKNLGELMGAVDKAMLSLYGKGISFYATKDRHREIADVRNMAMCIAWEFSRGTLKDISAYFNRNHATMCCSMNNVKDMRALYPSYEANYQKLKTKIYEICEKESILLGGLGRSSASR